VAAAVLSLFVISGLRAAHLQIVRAPDLRERAADQTKRRLKLLPARGTIYDRNLRELAVSIPGGSVFVDPSELLPVPQGLERLCGVLGLDVAAAHRQLQRGGRRFRVAQTPRLQGRGGRPPGPSPSRRGLVREAHRFYP